MEFLKKHYEKVLLGVVLLGLTVAVALLPIIVKSKREALATTRSVRLNPKVKPLPPLDLSAGQAALQRMASPYVLDFTHNHNLFNPVAWEKGPDGKPVRVPSGAAIGPQALQVTDIKPLFLQLTFNSVSGSSYLIGFENEAASQAAKRKGERLASKGAKNELFTLLDIKGTAESPAELVLELNESGEHVSVGPGKPFKRVDGYMADLKYPPENNRAFPRKRVGDALVFGGGQYKIVAITQTNVVISANSNDKKTTINFNAVTDTR